MGGGRMVVTASVTPIEVVRAGDMVYHLGKWRRVLATSLTRPPPTYQLNLAGGLTITTRMRYKLAVRRNGV